MGSNFETFEFFDVVFDDAMYRIVLIVGREEEGKYSSRGEKGKRRRKEGQGREEIRGDEGCYFKLSRSAPGHFFRGLEIELFARPALFLFLIKFSTFFILNLAFQSSVRLSFRGRRIVSSPRIISFRVNKNSNTTAYGGYCISAGNKNVFFFIFFFHISPIIDNFALTISSRAFQEIV